MRRFAIGVVLAATLVIAAGCGGSSPTAPSVVNLAGTWSGTMQYTQSPSGPAAQFVQGVSMSLSQSGNTINGTWTTTSGTARNGTVGGTVTSNSFSGSFTYGDLSVISTPCTGTLAVSGSASSSNLMWTSPTVVENCTDPPVSITIAEVHQ
jgi:hypothetical protein